MKTNQNPNRLLVICMFLSVALQSLTPSTPIGLAQKSASSTEANGELQRILPRSDEVAPWEIVPDTTVVALQPDDLSKVYGKIADFFRDWKVLSAAAAKYRYAGMEASATIACLTSPRDALLLFTHVRQAAETVNKVASLPIGQSAFWYETADRLFGAAVKDNAYSTVEFATRGQLSQSTAPMFLSALTKRIPHGLHPFTLWVNGQLISLDTPVEGDGGVQIPLRPVFTYFGYDALWIEKSLDVVFIQLPSTPTKETPAHLSTIIKLKVNRKEGFCDGKRFNLTVAPFTFNGSIYGSPEVFEKALGKKVHWDASSRRLEIHD